MARIEEQIILYKKWNGNKKALKEIPGHLSTDN
jgi:hypothetical protein